MWLAAHGTTRGAMDLTGMSQLQLSDTGPQRGASGCQASKQILVLSGGGFKLKTYLSQTLMT